MEAWLQFARSGDPGHSGLPDWPRYERVERKTMVFDATCVLDSDPLGEERRAWDGLL